MQTAYYCTRECQVAAWRQRHKQACRKPDQREVGDLMTRRKLEAKPELNFCLVVLKEELPNGRWKVEIVGAREPKIKFLSVAPGNLAHIRPETFFNVMRRSSAWVASFVAK